MSAAAKMAGLQALSNRAAADEAEVIAELQPLVDLGKRSWRYSGGRRARDRAALFARVLIPLIVGKDHFRAPGGVSGPDPAAI